MPVVVSLGAVVVLGTLAVVVASLSELLSSRARSAITTSTASTTTTSPAAPQAVRPEIREPRGGGSGCFGPFDFPGGGFFATQAG